jgi:hypothetical protein
MIMRVDRLQRHGHAFHSQPSVLIVHDVSHESPQLACSLSFLTSKWRLEAWQRNRRTSRARRRPSRLSAHSANYFYCACILIRPAVVGQTKRQGDTTASSGEPKAHILLESSTQSCARLWAATGQAALEDARILVLSASATSTSILKNLVLPGIGHYTILDPGHVSPEDAGNNFFFEGPSSIGKSRAEEAVRLLNELNDGVQGSANTANLGDLLENDPGYLTSFTLVVAHNLKTDLLEKLAKLLWEAPSRPILVTVDSAGFVAEFSIQFHEHDSKLSAFAIIQNEIDTSG